MYNFAKLSVCEPVVEEVVETEAITLATADGQIVRVISKEQYERWSALHVKVFVGEFDIIETLMHLQSKL